MKTIPFLKLLFILISVECYGQYGENTAVPFVGVENSSVAFADVNNDGNIDVLISGNSSSGVITKLYLNDSSGNFTEMSTTFPGVENSSVAFEDVDGDNDSDLLITGSDGNLDYYANLYLNDGNGNFIDVTDTQTPPFVGVEKGSVKFFDYDNDNDKDVIISGFDGTEQTTKIYVNDGSGFYSELDTSRYGIDIVDVQNSSIEISDFNSNGTPDVLITGLSSTGITTRLYDYTCNNVFLEPVSFNIENVQNASVNILDLNSDIFPDVLITGSTSSGPFSKLYINNGGDGSFLEDNTNIITAVENSSTIVKDLNNDGAGDIFITGNSTSGPVTKLYLRSGNSFIEDTSNSFVGVENSSIAVADVNNDGILDLLISGSSTSGPVTKLYLYFESTLNTTIFNDSSSMKFYPNPVIDYMFIPNASNITLYFYNEIGQLIIKKTIDDSNQAVDLRSFNSGIYFVKSIDINYNESFNKIIIK